MNKDKDESTFLDSLRRTCTAGVEFKFTNEQLETVDWSDVRTQKGTQVKGSGLFELVVLNKQTSVVEVIAIGPPEDLRYVCQFAEEYLKKNASESDED